MQKASENVRKTRENPEKNKKHVPNAKDVFILHYALKHEPVAFFSRFSSIYLTFLLKNFTKTQPQSMHIVIWA